MKKIIFLLGAIFVANFGFCADFSVFKLDNGQNVIIQEVRNNPIVTIDTWVKTGSINENDKNNGVSHFLEHLFFKGTDKHPAGEFDKILESKGAITNAATSKDFTHYYVTLPSKFFDLALEMHSDMLLNPAIPQKELEKERLVVIEEISKDENLPSTLCYENLVKMLYKTHPYKRKVIGSREIIENISRDEILSYYNTYYAPSNMVTIIVGDVDTQEALKKVKAAFNSKNYQTPKNKYPIEPQLKEQAKNVDYQDVQSGYMLIGYRAVPINAKDSYALDVLSTILGDGKSSVFYRKIKDEKQLAYSISAANGGFKDDGIFYINANFVPEKYKALEAEIFKVIRELQKNGVTDEQLKIAKSIIERDTFYSRESISSIANQIGYTFVTSGDANYYDNYLKNISNVTVQDVKRVANKYLLENRSAISVVLPENVSEHPISNITSLKYESPELIGENNDTQKFRLQNRATLLITPNKSNDIIGINITVKGGMLNEAKTGVSKLLAATLQKGTKNYTSQELAEILEGHGINISQSVNRDAFEIDVLTTKNEYDLTLKLLNEIVNNAKFEEYEIEKTRNNIMQSINQTEDQPLSIAVETFKDVIYGNSPYNTSVYTMKQALSNITREDILNRYYNLFNPENITVSICGNVDKDKTFSDFTNMFGRKENENPVVWNNYKIPQILSPYSQTKSVPKTNTAWILLGWQTSGLQNLKEYVTLQVINAILGTGMNSRLFKSLREDGGLAYQVGSSSALNVLRGHFITFIGTNPRNVDIATKGMFAEINKMKSEFVSKSELQNAKDKILGQYLLSQETNLEKASTIGWYEASGRGFNFRLEYEKLLNSVTESDIIDVANRIFNDNYIKIIVK